MITLSNMVKTTTVELDDDYVMDMYEQSVTMSTYLLAFIVSDFKSTHSPGMRTVSIKRKKTIQKNKGLFFPAKAPSLGNRVYLTLMVLGGGGPAGGGVQN